MDQPCLPSVENATRALSGEMRGDSVLVLAVVIHRPYFFRAGAVADEVDLCFGDAVDAAAEAEDDLVRKAVRDSAGHVFGCGFVVLLAEHLRIGGVSRIVEPTVDGKP